MIRTNPYAKYGLLITGAVAGYYGYNHYMHEDRSKSHKYDAGDAIRRGRDSVNETIDRGKERTDEAASSIKRGADKLKEKISSAVESTSVGKK